MRHGQRHGQREGKMGGKKRAEEGLDEEGREQVGRGARGEAKLQGRYPEEDTGQCTVYSQTIPQRGPWP